MRSGRTGAKLKSTVARRPVVTVGVASIIGLGGALAVGTVLASIQDDPAMKIELAKGGQPIENQYIVVLDTSGSMGVVEVNAQASYLTKKYGGTVLKVFHYALDGFSVRATPQQIRGMAGDDGVAYVEQDSVMRAFDTQPGATWGLDRIDQRNLPLDGSYSYSTSAQGVTAYIVDTGIRTTHSDFGGRASVGVDEVGDGKNGQDGNGHGTHVAGTVGGSKYGVAKGVKLVAVRVLGSDGSGSNSGVIAGIDWVTKNAAKPAVANMSLGGGVSETLDSAVRRSISSGVTYALAAGNENADASTTSPARTAEAITVGATEKTDARASYSNYGSLLDIFGPGSNITSDWMTNDTATNTISGTSMASPHVAGAAALYLAAQPGASPSAVRDGLVAAGTAGLVTSPGSGSPNRLLYNQFAATTPTPTPTPTTPKPTTPVPTPTTPTPTPTTPTPTTPAPTQSPTTYTNNRDVWFSYYGNPTAASGMTFRSQTGNAPEDLQVGVNIRYGYRGALTVVLAKPDGTRETLKSQNLADRGRDVNATYTVDASSVPKNGTWRLLVYRASGTSNYGYIDRWSLRF